MTKANGNGAKKNQQGGSGMAGGVRKRRLRCGRKEERPVRRRRREGRRADAMRERDGSRGSFMAVVRGRPRLRRMPRPREPAMLAGLGQETSGLLAGWAIRERDERSPQGLPHSAIPQPRLLFPFHALRRRLSPPPRIVPAPLPTSAGSVRIPSLPFGRCWVHERLKASPASLRKPLLLCAVDSRRRLDLPQLPRARCPLHAPSPPPLVHAMRAPTVRNSGGWFSWWGV